MTDKTAADERILAPEELVRLFYRYPINGFPVLDDEYRFSGVVQKRYIVNSLPEFRANRMDTRRIIEKHVYCPAEGDIVRLIFGDRKIQPFPVLHRHGRYLGEWSLSKFFQVFDTGTLSGLIEYEQVFSGMPYPILIIDERGLVLAGTTVFAEQFFPVTDGQGERKKLKSLARKSGWDCEDRPDGIRLQDGPGHAFHADLVPIEQKNGKRLLLAVFGPSASLGGEAAGPQAGQERTDRDGALTQAHLPHEVTLVAAVENLEMAMIRNTLDECGFNVSWAAARLDIPRQTLQYKMVKYGIRSTSL